MEKAQNLQDALDRAINAVNFGTTNGQQVSGDGFTVKSGSQYTEAVLLLNQVRQTKEDAERTAAFWGELIRKNYSGDFVVRAYIEGRFSPIELPFINWID